MVREFELKSFTKYSYLVIIVLGINHFANASIRTISFTKHGKGFTSDIWRTSPSISAVKEFSDRVVYSNGASILNFYGFKNTHALPYKLYPMANEKNLNYVSDYEHMIKDVISDKGVIILLSNKKYWNYLPSKDELNISLSKDSDMKEFSDGTIYY